MKIIPDDGKTTCDECGCLGDLAEIGEAACACSICLMKAVSLLLKGPVQSHRQKGPENNSFCTCFHEKSAHFDGGMSGCVQCYECRGFKKK